MQRRRIQLGIRWVMIAVALVALNLGVVRAVPEPPARDWMRDYTIHLGGGPRTQDFPGEGLTCRFMAFTAPGAVSKDVERVVQDPLPDTLPQIWSPVIASASITLLVLAAFLVEPAPRRGGRGNSRRRSAHQAAIGMAAGHRIGDDCDRPDRLERRCRGASAAIGALRPGARPAFYFRTGGIYLVKAGGEFEFLSPNWDLVFTWFAKPAWPSRSLGDFPPLTL